MILALTGLVVARVAIAEFVVRDVTVDEVLADPELLTEAAVMELAFTGGFSPALQEEYDAVPYDAVVPEALYADLQAEAATHIQDLDDGERRRLAEQVTDVMLADVSRTELIVAQLSLFDLLWVFLAVSTAWKMMSGIPIKEPEEPEAPPSITG